MGLREIQALKAAAKIPKQKKAYRIPAMSEKKKQQIKEDKALLAEAKELGKGTGISAQEQWFNDRMAESEPVCMECSFRADWLKLPEYEKVWRACQAHIIPKAKSQFPSVATHPLNHLVLFPSWGGHLCGCHGFYDSNWFNATTMKVWPKAVEKFKQFESSIAPAERRKIPEQFINH